MNFQGRNVDPVALWESYVDFPPSVKRDENYAPLVQCPNPNHSTMKRHFQINLREPKVHCFAHCGISGGYEHAICVVEGLYEKYKVDLSATKAAWEKKPRERTAKDREEIRRATRARREASKTILRQSRGTAKVFTKSSARKKSSASSAVAAPDLSFDTFIPQVGIDYLESRKINSDSISTWGLGWDADSKRIVIPAHDENGHLRFLIKRALSPKQQPKYLYTEGFPRTSVLFGLDRLDLGMVQSHGLALVEGSFNTIRLHQHGLRISAAILGTGLSEAQRRIISRINPPRIYLFFDKDAAGIRNIEIATAALRKYPLYVIRYPRGKSDPAELTRREAWSQYRKAISLREFQTRVSARQRKVNFG